MAVRTLAYECKYCGTLKRSKHICERHELTCFQNPDAKNCVRCKHVFKGNAGRVCIVTGKRCSVAVSASCKHFDRRQSNE